MVEVIKCPPGVAKGAYDLKYWSATVKGIVQIPKKKKKKGKKARKKEAKIVRQTKDEFYGTYEWRKLRYVALKKYGATCQCCGRSARDGVVMNVDHIKPRKKYPELALDLNNLQVLCAVCNHGKGNWDETDWREPDLAVVMGEKMA